MRIQHLIEETPTIEHRKLANYNVYKKWKCPRCKRKKETFNHLWLCKSDKKHMNTISENCISFIIEELHNRFAITLSLNDQQILRNLQIFKLKADNDNLTFIDLIKGIFPFLLTEIFIKFEIRKQQDIVKIGNDILQLIFKYTNIIWKQRNDILIKEKKRLKLQKK